MPGRLFFVNKAFWNMVPKVWHDFGKEGSHAGRGKTGKWHDFGEGGGHAVSGEKGVWHDIGKGGGHAGRGKRGYGMTLGKKATNTREVI